MRKVLIKKRFLFTVGSVCHVKRFTAGSRNSLKTFETFSQLEFTCSPSNSSCNFVYEGESVNRSHMEVKQL
jgi:hypothetical protein